MGAFPTFLVIGAQKAGTTWLSDMLRQHPAISMPDRKELHFFDVQRDHDVELARYCANFDVLATTQAVGEATPNYLGVLVALPPEVAERCDPATFGAAAHPGLNPDSAATIARLLPGVQLVVVLRDPVARAVSSFRHQIRMGRLPPGASILGPGG